MKPIEEMSAKELREYADNLIYKAEILEHKVTKTAVLKHNVYKPPFENLFFEKWTVTEEEKDFFIKSYADSFDLFLQKGTKFICQNIDGINHWSAESIDRAYKINDVNWIEENLENIQDV